jgi:cobalt-zinc-cadmium efflux system outer membrane protein
MSLVLGFASVAWPQAGQELRYGDGTYAVHAPEPLPAVDASSKLTLEALEQRALESNPSVRRLAALVDAARANTLQVGLLPNPSVGYEGQQLGSGGLAEQHGVLFTQEIVRGGKLQLNRAVADRERMRLEQEFAVQRQRVLNDVRVAYYDVLLSEQQIELTENLIYIGDEGVKSVDALFKAKEVGQSDTLQAQLEVENAKILAENARNRRDSAWRSLAAIIGEPNLAPQAVAGSAIAPAKEFDFQQSLARLLRSSPEIAAAAMEVERARAALSRARVEPVSNINVQGLVNWRDNGIGGKPDGGVAVSLPLPVFNRNQGGIARAEHELIAAREGLTQLELELQNRLAPVFEQYANSRNQVARYENTILPAAEKALDLTRQMYGAGEANYTVLLMSQRTYSQTQLNYLDAVRQLRISEIEIEGLLLRGSLAGGGSGPTADVPSTVLNSTPVGGLELFDK